MTVSHHLAIAVATPAHSALSDLLTYGHSAPLPAGQLVRTTLGSKPVLGVVWGDSAAPDPALAHAVKPLDEVWGSLPPLSQSWRALVDFAARYYQRSVGEMALAALPPAMRELTAEQLERRLAKLTPKPPKPPKVPRLSKKAKAAAEAAKAAEATEAAEAEAAAARAAAGLDAPESALEAPIPNPATTPLPTETAGSNITGDADADSDIGAPPAADSATDTPPELSEQQTAALAAIQAKVGIYLLHGNTGSGKTEVYMHAAAEALAQNPQAQVLVMVPEINLTPQLESRFQARFGADTVVAMHSGLTPAQRLQAWFKAHLGQARIVLGTRMAIFTSLPQLALIVVDEEHDPSYKQQEGARYSARDLAVWRGHHEGVRVVLGSATPSLESWWASRSATADEPAGRYVRLSMPDRVANAGETGGLPLVRRVDMNHQPRQSVLALPLIEAIGTRVARGEQCLLLLNRRGFAPVLTCTECGWKSDCPQCSTFRVFHKSDRSLRCHHCGLSSRVPHACPDCGNPDIQPLGRGTEQLQEQVQALLADITRADGSPVRIARIDADTTRLKGSLEEQLEQMHSGEVDVLVGTQMVAKGHDFRRVSLVAAVQPDAALFSSDFRAPERLFSLLMQAAGRAGRDASLASQAEMWVQSHQPAHPLYAALKKLDYATFADNQLQERLEAGLPPFVHQVLVRADARTQEAAQGFLQAVSDAARAAAETDPAFAALLDAVFLYPPVPLTVQRVAHVERAQMLIEAESRVLLQRFLHAWRPMLHAARKTPEGKSVQRWLFDVDPIAI